MTEMTQNTAQVLREVDLALNLALLNVDPERQPELRAALLAARRQLRVAVGEPPS